jgi:uncharacterized protein (TIGR00266 family)
MITEKGSMAWMTPNMEMKTNSNGGLGKMIGRAFAGEAMFQNLYTARGGQGLIAFASSFPGSIIAFPVTPQQGIIAQKSAFLASEAGVQLSVHFKKRLGAGLFGGEGFIMQKLSGNGMAFLEIDGHVITYDLAPGQQMIVDTGYLAAMTDTVTMDIQSVKGGMNVLFGGEGFFNTVVTGPGRVWLQTMPESQFAASLIKYLPSKG